MSDPYQSDLEPWAAVRMPSESAVRRVTPRLGEFVWPAACSITAVLSCLLPWVVVRVPGQSEIRTYGPMTGGGASLYVAVAGGVLLLGLVLWVAGIRHGLVVASASLSAVAVVAVSVVVVASLLGQLVPTVGLFGSRFASGQLTPGMGASLCVASALVFGSATLSRQLAPLGVDLRPVVDKLTWLALGLLVVADLASHTPWVSVEVGDGPVAFDLHGDALVGAFLVSLLGWAAAIILVAHLVTRRKGVGIVAFILIAIFGALRLLYCVVPWLGMSSLSMLLPDDLAGQASVDGRPALLLSSAVAVGLGVVGVVGSVSKARASAQPS